MERNRLRRAVCELEELARREREVRERIAGLLSVSAALESKIESFSPASEDPLTTYIQAPDWPSDVTSVKIRSQFQEIRTLLCDIFVTCSDLDTLVWIGTVEHIVNLLVHPAYVMCKAMTFFDVPMSRPPATGPPASHPHHASPHLPSFSLHANGYRSLLRLTHTLLTKLTVKLTCAKNGGRRAGKAAKTSEAFLEYLRTFSDVLQIVFEIAGCESPGEIFPKGGCDDVIGALRKLNLEVFYGKYFGMQFGDGLRLLFTGLLVAMASFGRNFKSDSPELFNKAKALMTSPVSILKTKSGDVSKYIQSPDMAFLRSFWNLQETVLFVDVDTHIKTKSPDVNVVVTLTASPLMFVREDTKEVFSIGPGLPLQCHTPGVTMDPGISTVQVRLISFNYVSGQIQSQKDLRRDYSTVDDPPGSVAKTPLVGQACTPADKSCGQLPTTRYTLMRAGQSQEKERMPQGQMHIDLGLYFRLAT